jgi:small ligand-binding sensory domain FIST
MTATGYATALLMADAFDEGRLRARVEEARRQLPGGRADLALVFASPPLLPQIREINELIQVHGHASLLAGCSAHGVIGQSEEVEEGAALSILLLSLPGAHLTPARFTAADVEESNGPGWWHAHTGVDTDNTRGWLFFADPREFDAERWLRQWNEAYPGVPCLGGLAGGSAGAEDRCLFLNQEVFTDGGIGISVGGSVRLEAIVSQGCTPIGRPWTITAADRNFIQRIGNLPALTVLQDTFNALPALEKARANGNIFVGLAVDEYLEEHRRGDFLVRNLLGADPNKGGWSLSAPGFAWVRRFSFSSATAPRPPRIFHSSCNRPASASPANASSLPAFAAAPGVARDFSVNDTMTPGWFMKAWDSNSRSPAFSAMAR